MSVNRNQHVVPRLYLRKFTNADRKLWVFEKSSKFVQGRSTKSVAYEEYAFDIFSDGKRDSSFDVLHNTIESFIGPTIKNLSPDTIFDPKVNSVILVLTADLITRSRRLRDSQVKPMRQLTEKLKNFKFNVDPSDPVMKKFGFENFDMAEAVEKMLKGSELIYPLTQTFFEDVANILVGMKFKVLKAPDGDQFVTSDDPVIVTSRDGVLLDSLTGFFQVMCLKATLSFSR